MCFQFIMSLIQCPNSCCRSQSVNWCCITDVFSVQNISLISVVSKSLLQKPGSELVLYNSFMSESDLPKVCYAQKHKKEGPSKVDYFSCKQCNFKCKYHSDKQFSCLKVKTQNPTDSERN